VQALGIDDRSGAAGEGGARDIGHAQRQRQVRRLDISVGDHDRHLLRRQLREHG
jgi:hypothetical protein